jgi:hypothetical protein
MRKSWQCKPCVKHNFNNQTMQKEMVCYKAVWEEIQNEKSEGQTPPQNAGSWSLTKQRPLFYKNFLDVVTFTNFDLAMSSASMKVDFQVCGIPLLSLFLKAKERRSNHKFEKSRSVWCSLRYRWLLVFIFYRYWFVKIPLELSVCSKSGWMKEDVVVMWFKHLAFSFQYCIHNPKLLITDFSTHTSFANPDFCKEFGFIAVSIPPHVSYKCSPWMYFFRVLNLFPDLI